MGKKPRFNIPDTAPIVQHSRYKLGDSGYNFFDIKGFRPIFAFDYLSLKGGELCFDSEGLIREDYIGLLQGLRMISSKTYEELKVTKNYRFHTIDFDDKRVAISRKDFKMMLVPDEKLLPDEQMPHLYQLDFSYQREARICGFLYQGVFYLVWYDRDHKIYPKK